MGQIRNGATLRALITSVTLAIVAVSCGGGSSPGTSVSSGTSTGSGAGTSGGGGSGTSGGGGTGGGTSTSTVLFEQPTEGGISGHFAVPLATKTSPPKGAFALVLWQPDRFSTNGELVPTGWDAGTQTGFTPSTATSAQLGFQNLPGTSTAQMEGDTVGAYINSQDLPPSTADQKMMITPEFRFQAGSEPMPFSNSQASLCGELDLQIPTALGPDAYVTADFLFEDPNGVRISIGVLLFRNGSPSKTAVSGYDVPSSNYMLNSPLGIDQRFITRATGSNSATGMPWAGWQHFEWSMSEAQFVSALETLVAAFPGHVTSTDPTHYILAEIHLNAEFHTQGHAAELGWSMRGLKIWSVN